ncbi:MAG: hypothetical protein KAR16_06450 [Bacteroidales bacterium]|nr:hypothetical protein [Bacteroidales bacterium]
MEAKKVPSLTLCAIGLLTLFILQPGCGKVEPANESPIIITNLSDGDAFERGIVVSIHVDIEENHAGIIAEIRIFIDNQEVSVAQDFPCCFDWNSEDEEAGDHMIRLTTTDSDNNRYSDEYHVRLYDMNTQACQGAETVTDWDGNEYKTIKLEINAG